MLASNTTAFVPPAPLSFDPDVELQLLPLQLRISPMRLTHQPSLSLTHLKWLATSPLLLLLAPLLRTYLYKCPGLGSLPQPF